MIKILCADAFFTEGVVDKLVNIAYVLPFEDNEYGQEIMNFNMVPPDLDPIFSKMVGEPVSVIDSLSGVFRKPIHGIHFESFESAEDWIFYIALEPTTFNLYNHIEDVNKVNSRNALEGYRWNYQNMMEWDCYCNILLEPNQGVIFKPWLFHSLAGGLVQVYRLGKVSNVAQSI